MRERKPVMRMMFLTLGALLFFTLSCRVITGEEAPTEPVLDTPAPPTEALTAIPTVTGPPVDLHDIWMVTETDGWALGSDGDNIQDVFVTRDGAYTWDIVTPPEAPPEDPEEYKAAVVYFMDSLHGWVTYSVGWHFRDDAVVWITQDGGQSWQASAILPGTNVGEYYSPSQMLFVAGGTGWLRSSVGAGMHKDYHVIVISADGGNNWELIVDPYMVDNIHSCGKTGMTFLDANTGLLTRDCMGVVPTPDLFWTFDGGRTWIEQQLPAPASAPTAFDDGYCGVYSPILFSAQHALVALNCATYGDDGRTEQWYVYSTLDGGLNWQTEPFSGGPLMFIDDQIGWGIDRDIVRTIDGGQTWETMGSIHWDSRVTFVTEHLGWVIEYHEEGRQVFRTEDGGLTWLEYQPMSVP